MVATLGEFTAQNRLPQIAVREDNREVFSTLRSKTPIGEDSAMVQFIYMLVHRLLKLLTGASGGFGGGGPGRPASSLMGQLVRQRHEQNKPRR